MKTLITLGLILSPIFAVFAQQKAPAVQAQNDTLSFAFLITPTGAPIFDSSDCFIIGDLQAAKLLVFPVTSASADLMDELLSFTENKTKQTYAYYKCIVPKGGSGGAQYATIQKTLEAKLRLKLKMPNLRIRLIWAPLLFDGLAEVSLVAK